MDLFANSSAKDSAPNRSRTVLRTHGRQGEHILHIVVTGRTSVIRNENLREAGVPQEGKPIRGWRLAEISPTDQQTVSRNRIPAQAPVSDLRNGRGETFVHNVWPPTRQPPQQRV